jgi:lysozyme family protein
MPYSTAFEDALRHVLQVEGEFSNHPADPGGKTRLGITEREAREHGYDGPMSELPAALAKEIYHEDYWSELRLDNVSDLAAEMTELAEELFDTGVNMGPEDATLFLQVSLNALNRQEQDWSDIATDGVMGPNTLNALRALFQVRGERGLSVLVKMLNSLQGAEYIDLAEKNPDLEAFVFGWFRQRVR